MAFLKGAAVTFVALAVLLGFLLAPQPSAEPAADEPPANAPPAESTAPPSGPAPMDAAVAMKDMKFATPTVRIAVGGTVTWTNEDPMGHTVTPADKAAWGGEGSGDAPADWMPMGETWSHTFTTPGTYAYYCLPHAAKASDGSYRGMVGTVIVGEGGDATPAPEESNEPMTDTTAIRSPSAPSRLLPGEDGVVHVTLETREVRAQLADGVSYDFWTFDGTVPGPMLRVREGDTIELTLKNAEDSLHPHSIDLHAVTGPGGGAKVTQTAPGDATTFRWKAMNPGLYVYHCASPHIPTHVANGMYGMILVEPAQGLPPVDKEFYVMQGEIYTEGKVGEAGHQPFSLDKMLDEKAEYYLLNGRVGALTGDNALKAEVGDTVRIYFGVGGFVPSSFHVIGEIFDAVYAEGATSAPQENVQTTLVPAGGAAFVDFTVEYPGTYLLVDHWLTHAIDRGAAGHLVVTGDPDAAVFQGQETAGSGH